MNRPAALDRLLAAEPLDVVVVGGGATGLSVALDAATRGYRTGLVEAGDLAGETSSRSTRLVHGGVRYLARGDVPLVMEALRERARLRRAAPHVVRARGFVIPGERRLDAVQYPIGLALYDLLAVVQPGGGGFGRSRPLSRGAVARRMPTLRTDTVRSGTLYFDGTFDDARLAVLIARAAAEAGAAIAPRVRATDLLRERGRIAGIAIEDLFGGRAGTVRAGVVVNATGPFADELRHRADPDAAPMIVPSRGSHVVLPRRFLPGEDALLVPRTRDGRVLFCVPHGPVAIAGTTDVALDRPEHDAGATADEIDFILETLAGYLDPVPGRGDVLSTFAGVRPLARRPSRRGTASRDTGRLARNHVIHDDEPGLVTITGGKWTTCRAMAEHLVDHLVRRGAVPARPCATRRLRLPGAPGGPAAAVPESRYGGEANAVDALAAGDAGLLAPLEAGCDGPDALPIRGVDVLWAATREGALGVDDVLSRRTRCTLLDARRAEGLAAPVARLLAATLGRDEGWIEREVAAYRRVVERALPPA